MGNTDFHIDTLYEDLAEKQIKQCIHMGYSPKLLLQKVFDTIDKELDFGEKKMVLYCGSYGGYGYSQKFQDYMKEYHNDELQIHKLSDNEREVFHYIEQFAKFLNISIEEALKKASGDYCKLYVKIVPKHRDYKIHEYDGSEYVEILNDFTY
jgi:hypothetical protein